MYCTFFYSLYTVKWLNAKVKSERRTKVEKVASNMREQCIFARCDLIERVLALA